MVAVTIVDYLRADAARMEIGDRLRDDAVINMDRTLPSRGAKTSDADEHGRLHSGKKKRYTVIVHVSIR